MDKNELKELLKIIPLPENIHDGNFIIKFDMNEIDIETVSAFLSIISEAYPYSGFLPLPDIMSLEKTDRDDLDKFVFGWYRKAKREIEKIEFKKKIPYDVKLILNTLEDNGYPAYVVGGCCRDILLDKTPKDWDITTAATPDQIVDCFKDKYKIIPTGLQHGTVTVMINHTGYEITTFRIDGEYSDHRRPDSVEFTTDIVKDLARRDFTMNAIAFGLKEGFIDPFDGRNDIIFGRIGCVGNSNDRFKEDPLRILRAWRFACQLKIEEDFTIAPITLNRAESNIKLLSNISKERIRDEFVKALSDPKGFVNVTIDTDFFLFAIVPEFEAMQNFKQNNPYHIYDVLNHTFIALNSLKKEDDIITKLAVLFHDIGKPYCYQEDKDGIGHFYGHAKVGAEMTDKIMRDLKFDNKTRESVVELIKYHDATFMESKAAVNRWLNKIGQDQFKRLLRIRLADITGQSTEYFEDRKKNIDRMEELLDQILRENACFQMKDLKINGNDLIELGFTEGKELGEIKKKLFEMVMNFEIPNDRDVLLEEARKILKERKN